MADKNVKTPTAPVPAEDDAINPEYWQSLLKQVTEKSGGLWFFPGDGKTRIRLVWDRKRGKTFFQETRRYFRGKARTRYLVLGLVPDKTDEDSLTKVRPIVLNKTCLEAILNYLTEGYDLLSPQGHGIVINRTGNGLDTNYNIIASQKPYAVNFADLTWPEESLTDLAKKFEDDSRERDNNRVEEGAEQAAVASVKGQRNGAVSMGDDW